MPQPLPDEILSQIISYLPIRYILLLRQVSKHLNAITHDRSVWADAYRTSSLVRPAGPFAWQTAQMLESNIAQSTRLSLNWAPNDGAAPVRSRRKNIARYWAARTAVKLVLGRWLFVIQDQAHIVCHDLDDPSDEAPPSVLYECNAGSLLGRIVNMEYAENSLGERSGGANHPVGFVLLGGANRGDPLGLGWEKRALFSVVLADGTVPTLHLILYPSLDFIKMTLDIGPRLLQANTPDPILKSWVFSGLLPALIMDTETYQCYEFPASHSNPVKGVCKYVTQGIVTSSTHVLLLRTYQGQVTLSKCLGTHIQAYAIPPRQASVVGRALHSAPLTLQLTHECTTTVIIRQCTLLRDTQVDPTTGAMRIAIATALHLMDLVAPLSLTLHPAVRGVGSITVDPPKFPTPEYPRATRSFLLTPALYGSTRSVAWFSGDKFTHIIGIVLDDADRGDTHGAVELDMRSSQAHPVDGRRKVLAFDAYRGRLVVSDPGDHAVTVFDFV
ncbi:hypothetical protein BJ138DRAFT_496589 [Hygrophoropsis aurantiaca]|uniref:Uncharacterized protein n=1 Tax=Hygrophoropsis aurantiaca TaxID=72124 RepID=A0ACB8A3A3_9AGAM|nr:hypothetical protein BJ138DRAFT_496589 [Hygrophoropsis aurantiaca]